ncbi:MAG: glycosyltransferase [Proteobacteria bacterium]|nr:glycosyltransferase [Pseudomonadota bacterium]
MKVNVLPGTRFHSTQLIDKLYGLQCDVKVYSSSPKKNFKTSASFSYQFVPQIAVILERVFKTDLAPLELGQNKIYDQLCSYLIRDCDVLHGWAGLSLTSGIRAKRRGSVYLLERSCPHVLFQEELIARESEKLKVPYIPKPRWWLERSLQEYEEAHAIITPSDYTRDTMIERGIPQNKLKKIPLDRMVQVKIPNQKFKKNNLTVGTIVGNPLRKGLVYLLEAWEKIKLPEAKLIIKMNPVHLEAFPLLREMVQRQPSVEVRGFYPCISDFYHECDLFVLPSVDDGFGLVITEALAHGLPCIATDHVGAVENFKNLPFVKVVPAANSEALATQIQQLHTHQEELSAQRESIIHYFRSLKNRPSLYELGIEDLYQPLLNQKRSLFSQSDSLANPS